MRFQIEFLFRDAKQFTGLEDCQARDPVKLAFHFNLGRVNSPPLGAKPCTCKVSLWLTSKSFFIPRPLAAGLLIASLAALNLAKVETHQNQSGLERLPFSMTSVKRRALNRHLLDRFIANLDLEPSVIKSHPNYPTLCDYGMITA